MPESSVQEQKDEESARPVKVALLARDQPAVFKVRLEDFLLNQGREASQHTYHFGNSTIVYRTDYTEEQKECLERTGKIILHIALNLIARDRLLLADDIQEIQEQFPEFQCYQDYPDPLYFPKEARKFEL